MPQGANIPWDVWTVPLFWWFLAVMAGFTLMTCVAIIFRKQWAENERLAARLHPLMSGWPKSWRTLAFP